MLSCHNACMSCDEVSNDDECACRYETIIATLCDSLDSLDEPEAAQPWSGSLGSMLSGSTMLTSCSRASWRCELTGLAKLCAVLSTIRF